MMRLFFCGDCMPGGVLPYQEEYSTDALREKMRSYDFRIGTLEAAIGNDLPFDTVKMAGRQNIIFARDEDFFRMKELGFDVVSLANNHIWDLGAEGLENTVRILERNGIRYCGAGMDSEEASRPAVIEKEGLSVAVLAYCKCDSPWLGYVEKAGDGKPGVNPLDIDKAVEDIRAAKKKYDKVVVLPHWGKEYTVDPLPEDIAMAERMVEAGADAVLGSHPHRIQPIIRKRGVPVCFSMGNFLFPDFYMCPPRPIWYPSAGIDRSSIKDVVGYPYPITEPIRQVWRKVSRYGRFVSLTVSRNKVSAKSGFVHNSDENVIGLEALPGDERFLIWKSAGMISSNAFRFLLKLKRRFL